METLNKEKKLVSAVTYLHNDEDRIVKFLKTIIQLLKNNFESFEIIIVNDCSYDDSVERIKNDELLKKFNVSLLSFFLVILI